MAIKRFDYLSIRFDGSQLSLIDQTQLPIQEEYIAISSIEEMHLAIKKLKIRGAPAIGVAAAAALALFGSKIKESFQSECDFLKSARPTAVNLFWAIDRMRAAFDSNDTIACFNYIIDYEYKSGLEIAKNGFELIPQDANIITHCNTGGLATVGYGTALGVIRYAHEQGKRVHVYVDETRPLLQGGRLTTWELEKHKIPYTLICDNMAAALMQQKKIDLAIVGADRIAMNGDFANKIGTYSLAINCQYHKVNFYTAAPVSTLDPKCKSGNEIDIELRQPEEVRGVVSPDQLRWAPAKAQTWNPAFDVTPAKLLTGIISDQSYLKQDQFKKLSSFAVS